MEEAVPSQDTKNNRWTLYIILAIIVLAMFLASFIVYKIWSPPQTSAVPQESETLSEAQLEARYGLRVRLIGVTAGGGMVDFRLKIVDAQKASQLLLVPEKAPSLLVPDKGVTLLAPPDPQQDLNLEDGGVFFILFSNSGGAVQPGTPVIVSFGDLQLEPIPAQ